MDKELLYLLFVCALLILPRWLQRFRIPAPLACFAGGMLLAALAPGESSPLIHFAAVLGIASLFLFAGLEVNLTELLAHRWPLLRYLGVRSAAITASTWLAATVLDLTWQPALLIALAVLTSSTGFIIDSLDRFAMDARERFWVTNQAIAGELLALACMFVALQSESAISMAAGSATLLALVVAVPLAYLALARWVLPHAPGSEFSLLIQIGIVAAFVTDRLGVEYLLGAFIAGLAARQLERRLPGFASEGNVHAIKLFSSFFVPFYFFRNGAQVPWSAFNLQSLAIGLGLSLVLPLRIGSVWWQLRRQGLEPSQCQRIAVSLAPTLIFTLVLAHILHARFQLSDAWYAGLLIYAGINTLLPSLLLKTGFDLASAPANER
jgi:Kef-type K+ transport system membrane component KefB